MHACAATGVKRLLHMSALNADPSAPSAYLRSKGLGEAIVREAGMQHSENENWYLNGPKFVHGYGLEVTVFRPSVIFGREDSFINMFAGLLKIAPVLPLASPDAKFQPVFVEDVAQAFVASLNNPGHLRSELRFVRTESLYLARTGRSGGRHDRPQAQDY